MNPKKECMECGSDNVVFKEAEQQTVCQDCGAVFEKLAPADEQQFEEAREE